MCSAAIGGWAVVDGEGKEEEGEEVKGATASVLLSPALGSVLKGWMESHGDSGIAGGRAAGVGTPEEERNGEGLGFERVLFSGATFAWSSSKLLLVPVAIRCCACVTSMACVYALEDVSDSIFVSIKSHVSAWDSGKT